LNLTPIIFWDWNGTLLDDIDICIDSMNAMLNRRSMPNITKNRYKEIFNFPVIDYYRELGFNFDHTCFEDLSVEFISEYNSRVHQARLHPSVYTVLEALKKSNKIQVIVSAMEQTMLNELLEQHKLKGYFQKTIGLSNIYAHSKVHLAQDYIVENKINPKQITLIGDTIHDAEVAEEIGSNLILVSHGHHSQKRLYKVGTTIISNLEELLLQLN
jgi:phosphoglycolate phosphatase